MRLGDGVRLLSPIPAVIEETTHSMRGSGFRARCGAVAFAIGSVAPSPSAPSSVTCTSTPLPSRNSTQLAPYQAVISCLAASHTRNNVRMSLADIEDRWPALGKRDRAAQLTDFLAVPLFADQTPVGSLNLYSSESFDNSVYRRDRVAVRADYLSHALDVAAHNDRWGRAATALRDAVGARVDIERAVGVLMNVNECDASVAFPELETRSAADSGNILEVARRILASIDDGSA